MMLSTRAEYSIFSVPLYYVLKLRRPMEKLTSFYRNKKILVTGATGFKGSWLCCWLLKLGAIVYGTGYKPNKNKNLLYVLNLQKKINLKLLDIRDFKKVNKFINEKKPQIIFHLAAQPLVHESYKYPMYTFDVNIKGTLNILEASKNCKSVMSIICVTNQIYKNKNKKFKETYELDGIDPYNVSKASAELIVNSYREIFKQMKKKCAVSSVSAGNIVGGGDWSNDRIVPDAIKSIRSNKILLIRNPNFTRPWQFVLEPLKGYLLLAKKQREEINKFSGNWSFGPSQSSKISVIEIVKLIIKFWGKGNYKIKKNKKFKESKNLILDINKTKKHLKWQPTYNTKKAIKLAIKWYLDVIKNKKSPSQVTNEQISSYMNLANLK